MIYLSRAKKRPKLPFPKNRKYFQTSGYCFCKFGDSAVGWGSVERGFSDANGLRQNFGRASHITVSTANNHAFDVEGKGIADTLNALQEEGIAAVGTGSNLFEASAATIREIKGQKLAFLAFTYGVNPTITPLGFATKDRSGAAPMDPYLIKTQIAKIREQVDFVIVSLHWGLENKTEIHPKARKFAQDIIDSGADIILGHHPHVPRGVEVYNRGLIVYSMGNLIFGHNHKKWPDNFLIRFAFRNRRQFSAQIIPIAGTGIEITQPFVLNGKRAHLSKN